MMRRDVVSQALFLLIIALIGLLIWQTTVSNLSRLSVKSGFGFLAESAPFELGETMIPYSAGDTYFRAFFAGVLNTIKVAFLGIMLSTILGLFIALGQLSSSIVLSRLCRGYIEVLRNVPLLLQLIFWHTVLTRSLPTVRQAMSPVDGVFLTNRGLYVPAIHYDPSYAFVGVAALAGLAAAIGLGWVNRRRRLDGQPPLINPLWAFVLLIAPPLLAFLAAGAPLAVETPELKGFNFRGGVVLTPEFVAMLMGLTFYHATFNAEIIRAGILGVSSGQREAGLALGLSKGRVMRLIILPQALRIIIPPITNSHLSLTKESSLAVAIGYPEIVRVANITLAETSQVIECISIIMLVYLVLSLTTSLFLNWVNARVALVER